MELDFDLLLSYSSIVDSSDDYFLIFDLYKIFLFSLKRIFMSQVGKTSESTAAHESHQNEFLMRIQDCFFQQLI